MPSQNTAFEQFGTLVESFEKNERHYMSSGYQESEARKDFIDKMLIALEWDVNHDTQKNPFEQEVKVERSVTTGASQRRADYAFYITPNFRDPRFFVEAKKPSVDITNNKDAHFQLVRYGWSSQTPIAVLTDFEQLLILDCRYKPNIETALNQCIRRYHYKEYATPDKFAEIYHLLSRSAVSAGSLEKFVALLPSKRGKAVQRGLFKGAFQKFDEAFLEELDGHRDTLARAFKNKNPDLDGETLTEITQRTIDRLVFIRFLEDKLIHPEHLVANFGDHGTAWQDFVAASRTLDGIYNGIVFKKHEILDAPSFKVDDDGFADICEDLSHVNSAYDFNAIPIHILGSIYERFLGKVIVTTDKRARVEEKPEVRKAGGVYYTPDYIVRYIVENTVGKLIEGKTPAQIAEMRFADIACGSGSFLLGVYDLLLRYHLQWFNADNDKAKKAGCLKREDGAWHLSLKQRREILLNNIYGVDIDHQAVEVAQLSLYLKLLEDESTATAHDYQLEFHETLLPSLNKNIVCGNSLVGRDISTGDFFEAVDERTLNPMDFEDRFPDILKRGGFDAVVGNPPYRMLQPHNTDAQTLGYLREHYVAADFKVEIFHLFLQRAASLVKKAGFQSYIVPTTVLNNVYAESLRKWLLQKCSIDQICIARGRIFADADVHTSVLIFQLEPDAGKRNKRLVKTTAALSQQFVASPHFESHTKQETFSKLPGSVWNILVNEQNKTLISRLTTNFTPLKQVATINRGLVTGDRKKYFATEQVTKRHVPIITGSDVLRYLTKSPGEFVLFKRPEAAGGCWDPDVHFAPHKLVVRQICETPTASIVSSPIAVTANIFTIRAKNLENELYLLGIINSRLMKFFWKTMFTDFKDSFPQVTIFSLEQLPICVLDTSESNEMARFSRIVALVEQMLSAEKQLSGAQSDKNKNFYSNKCESVDRQIDELVYELYALTEKEITIVKDSTADSRHS